MALLPTYASEFRFTGSWWSPEKGKVLLPTADEVVNQGEISELLNQTRNVSRDEISSVIDQALHRASLKDIKTCELKDEFVQGLTLKEAAMLLNYDYKTDPQMRSKLFEAALRIKQKIYGDRVVLFAPIYTANYCSNSCLYCGFRGANAELDRVIMSDEELREDVSAMLHEGHKRTVMLCGEHPKYAFKDFLRQVNVAGGVTIDNGSTLRRINVEIPPLSIHDYKRLKTEGEKVGTNILFEETYHSPTYEKFHVSGPKADYQNRLTVEHRSLAAGLDDYGLGVLYGLADWRFDTLAMIAHAEHLNGTVGVGPHTISVPRIKPASNAPASHDVPHPVSDDDFKNIVAVLRLAVPYTGMILSTRENEEMRRDLLNLGVSELSAGSCTDPGGYAARRDKNRKHDVAEFDLSDERDLEDVVVQLMKDGFLPSQCTSCYGVGRTGQTFMQWAKTGDIENYCLPNGLITLAEYLEDYAGNKTKMEGHELIQKKIGEISDKGRREATEKALKAVKKGERGHLF